MTRTSHAPASACITPVTAPPSFKLHLRHQTATPRAMAGMAPNRHVPQWGQNHAQEGAAVLRQLVKRGSGAPSPGATHRCTGRPDRQKLGRGGGGGAQEAPMSRGWRDWQTQARGGGLQAGMRTKHKHPGGGRPEGRQPGIGTAQVAGERWEWEGGVEVSRCRRPWESAAVMA